MGLRLRGPLVCSERVTDVGSPTARFEPREARKGAAVEESECGGPLPFCGDAMGSLVPGLRRRARRALDAKHLDDRSVVGDRRVESKMYHGSSHVLCRHGRGKPAAYQHVGVDRAR